MRRHIVRKRTWAVVAVLVFAAGDFAIHEMTSPSGPVGSPSTTGDAGVTESISRATDSELEVEPHLAARADGQLAVAWMALGGGRDEDGAKYIGLRVSAPNVGQWGPLLRVRSAKGRAADPVLSVTTDGFLLTWRSEFGNVYSARIVGDRVDAAVPILEEPHEPNGMTASEHVWSTVTPDGTVVAAFAYEDGLDDGVALAYAHDGVHFTRKVLASGVARHHDRTPMADGFSARLPFVCADDHAALAVWVDETRGVMAAHVALDTGEMTEPSVVSMTTEKPALEAPACFIAGQEADVIYGTIERRAGDAPGMTVVSDALTFARSKDGGKSFWTHGAHRPSSRLLHPTFVRAESGAYGVLAVMGAGEGDTHASASVIALSADGRSQTGLTRTAVAPLTFAVRRDGPGFMGDYFGLVRVGETLYAAVVDNASGESHVAVVRIP